MLPNGTPKEGIPFQGTVMELTLYKIVYSVSEVSLLIQVLIYLVLPFEKFLWWVFFAFFRTTVCTYAMTG